MNKIKAFIKDWVPSLAVAVAISFLFNTYVAQAVRVPTGSMLPTIQLEDRLLVEKVKALTDFHFSDIVVFMPPIPDNKDRYVKRLIGLPGDTIEIKNGTLYRNGERVEEKYIQEKMNYSFPLVKVPEGHYFFLGDNRNESYDSHLWEQTPFVAEQDIIGKAVFRYFPLDHIGTID